jgi:hypothetical protein
MKYNKEARISVALKNLEIRKKRTPIQQIAVLNSRLGKEQGAKKERERLLKLIEESKNQKEEVKEKKEKKEKKKKN